MFSDSPGPQRDPHINQLLADVLESQGQGVVVLDFHAGAPAPRLAFCNPSFLRLTGHPEDTRLTALPDGLHAEKDLTGRLAAWHAAPSDGEDAFSGEGYLTTRSGGTLYCSWSYTRLAEHPGHAVGIYRDMTDRRRLQDALVHSQRLDAVGRLAGGLAHDFNNLLSVINGYCEILVSRAELQTLAGRELQAIHEAGAKASGLVRELLAFSRRQELAPQVLDLNHLIESHKEVLGQLLKPDKHLLLELDSACGNVRIDPGQLQQVILNLVLNARDALAPGGRITIGTTKRTVAPGLNRRLTDTPPGRYALLTVNDNGCGMDEETQLHLFEPFYTTKDEGKGTGLGLSLVYGVVQQSGGFIQVHSALQVGTTFEIYLPLVDEDVTLNPKKLRPLPSTGGRETILLFEPDEVLSKMLSGILTADGYRVLSANTAGRCLGFARDAETPVDLVIADIGLPDSPGEKLVRSLKPSHPRLKVLSMTSHPPRTLAWIEPGAQAGLSKPCALSDVLLKMRELLDAAAPDVKKPSRRATRKTQG